MKISLVSLLSGIALGSLAMLIVSISRAPTLPPVEYENGFSFDMPCPEHGSHTQIVSGNRIVRLYEITSEGEVKGEVVGEQIAEVLEMIKLMSSPQVIPNGNEESGK